MSPINNSPQRGYGDYVRQEDWDDETHTSASQIITPNQQVGVSLDVSRFLNTYIWNQIQTGDVAVTMLWTTTAGGAVTLGTRHLYLSSSIPNVAEYSVVNRGPFLSVTWLNMSAGNITNFAQVTPTNRINPLEFTPIHSQLIDVESLAIGVTTTVTEYPLNYYTGPCTVWCSPGAAGMRLDLDTLGAGDVWQHSNGWTLANGDNNLTMTAPPGAWRFRITTGANATANCNLAVISSATGSA